MSDPATAAPMDPKELVWLVQKFAKETAGVEYAIVVSADGLLLIESEGFPAESAEQLCAIAGGLQSLAGSAARLFRKGELEQILLRMMGGHLLLKSISDGSALAVLVSPSAELKVVAYQMTFLVESAGHALTPRLRNELQMGATR